MSRLNRAGRGSIKIPWNPFGYDQLPERFSQVLPGSKRKKRPRQLNEWKIVKGDLVELLDGKDKGLQGKVKEVIRSKNALIVAGLNTEVKRLDDPEQAQGTYVRMEVPLPYSQVALVDPSDKRPTTVSYRYTEKGEKVRVSDRTGRVIPKPPWERRDWKERSAVKDGANDTSPGNTTRSTYMPSLLHFHEEILLIQGIKPSVPKTKPSLRDLVIKELEKQQPAPPVAVGHDTGVLMKLYIAFHNFLSRVPFFRR